MSRIDLPTLLPVRERRRRVLLLAALHRASAIDTALLEQALERTPSPAAPTADAGAEVMPLLLALMRAALHEAGMREGLSDARLAGALAQSLVESALSEVRMEAQRAGHEASFHRLQPWLQLEIPQAEAERFAADTRQGSAGLQRALERLRRRFRQRIEAGLALWSAEGEQRRRLRRALHAAAATGESA